MRIYFLVTFFVVVWVRAVSLHAAIIDDAIFVEPFESEATMMANGGTFTAIELNTGFKGSAVRVSSGTLSFNVPAFSSSEGTVSFWLSTDYPFLDIDSHTFVQFQQAPDFASVYQFAVSDGWWEPGGIPYFYFVYQPNHTRTKEVLGRYIYNNQWNLMTVTWNNAAPANLDEREMTIYLNGRLLRRGANFSQAPPYDTPISPPLNFMVYVGSDRNGDRNANSKIDELAIFDRRLSELEVYQLYTEFLGSSLDYHENLEWMEPQLSQPYEPLRDTLGRVVENRFIFDEETSFIHQGIDTVLEKIQSANFNIYVPNVWHGRGVRYDSRGLEDFDESWIDGVLFDYASVYQSGEDPFADMIEQAHSRGIHVHGWFTVALRSWDKYPEWYMGYEDEDFYNVLVPEFRDYIVNLMLNFVADYEVDGINLDFIRSGINCADGDVVCREDYRDAIDDIVSRVVSQAKAIKPQLIFSVDASYDAEGSGEVALKSNAQAVPEQVLSKQGRNPIRWVQNGWIDAVFGMDYNDILDVYALDGAIELVDELHKPKITKLLGNWYRVEGDSTVYSQAAGFVERQLAYMQKKTPGVVALYWYSSLDQAQIEALNTGVFSEPAVVAWPIGSMGNAGSVRIPMPAGFVLSLFFLLSLLVMRKYRSRSSD